MIVVHHFDSDGWMVIKWRRWKHVRKNLLITIALHLNGQLEAPIYTERQKDFKTEFQNDKFLKPKKN